MTKITQNSILTSFTAINRLILRKCNPKLLNVNNTPVKTVFDSSWETRLKELSATNFNYHPNKRNLPPPSPCVVQLSDIATLIYTNWNLNGNSTIAAGCLLTIPPGQLLFIGSGLTLTNKGTITNNGDIVNNVGGTLTNNSGGTLANPGNFTNYGTLTNTSGGNIYNSGTIFNETGSIITNASSGTLTNQASGYIRNGNDFTNNGTINNLGTIGNYGTVNNAGGTITNSGTINNTAYNSNIYNYSNGTITNNAGGIINNINSAGIYTYLGGAIINIPGGTINNSDGGITIPPLVGSSCGVGTITGAIIGNQPIPFCIPDPIIIEDPNS